VGAAVAVPANPTATAVNAVAAATMKLKFLIVVLLGNGVSQIPRWDITRLITQNVVRLIPG
jgi:hypothetical protein